ncbi:uncharacterized protein N7469_011085 [Penicillium citrinum]|uniref:Uncharacterized protein n=1 Tax=Penicillium citrinum TaxID=5077 RepID=A0A9W9TDD5_PENCI|nr:uncharacterized protein N7469_011085 [Penicillium citrinum]KAJ5217460.1 hypothetical protein N7469_011085 [Penicillium citrinum]
MRFLRYSLALVCLSTASSLALSDQANDVLGKISDITDSLRSNEKDIDRYKGGFVASAPLAQGFYNTWSTLRTANAQVPTDTKFTREDADTIFHSIDSANDLSVQLFQTYKEKAPKLNQAGAGFTVPIFMQALYREADDYMVSLEHLMPPDFAGPMHQITAKHKAAWDATFAAYEPVGNPNTPQQFKTFSSIVAPVLGFLV